MVEQPSGEVCFLFTDVQGSTRLWAEHTSAMEVALARHDELLCDAIESAGGYVFSTAGDGVGAAFPTAQAAVAAAIAAQTELHHEPWGGLPHGLDVRMGLHLGTAQERARNYFGPVVNLAARVMSAAWGGQVLCTTAVADAVDVRTDPLGEHRLRDVPGTTTLLQVIVRGLRNDFPHVRTLDAAPSTIPAQRATFFGRHDDIAAVRRVLLDHRLVTLTGSGGVGKTRLAIEVAGREQTRRSGGAFFVDLASVDGRVDIVAYVAAACLVELDASQPPLDQLIAALTGRECLIVFDNCEHVLDASAEIVDHLLTRCPGVSVVATSREVLGLSGEHVHIVGSLDLGTGGEAGALFVERAAAVGGGTFEADDPRVSLLCTRLDGIPLAIELAAARTRTLQLEEIIERLEHGLDLLSATRRGSPDRHQTLRATIEWSYRLLDADERALFDLLGVFSGSFDLDAVRSISEKPDVIDLVEGLVLKSMMVTEPDEGTIRRYRLLDSLRAFALEQLGARPDENERALDAHARHYLARVAALPPSRSMARELRSEFEPDLGNILVASDRVVADVTEPLVFLLTNMGLFDEARRSCDAALASDIDDQRRGRLLVARAYVEATQDGTSDFRLRAAEALPYLTPGDGVWSAALGMTSVVEQMFGPDLAVPALQEAIASIDGQVSATADHDRAVLGFYLGGALMNQGAYELAAETQLEAARRLEVIEPTSLVRLWTGSGAAMSFTMLGQLDEASAAIDEVSELAGWTDWSADWYFARAVLLAHGGQIDEARETLRAIGRRFDNVSLAPMVSTVVAGFGVLACLEGRHERARELFDLITATRAAASTAVMYEAIGDLEGWSEEEFANRRVERVLGAIQRQGAMERSAFFAALGIRLREELGGLDPAAPHAGR